MTGNIPLLLLDWPAPANVRAAMSTRHGGVSAGPYASLNLGVRVGDDPAQVLENRRRLRHSLQLPQDPVWLKQVHGTSVIKLSDTNQNLEADASYATDTGIVCAVQTADCLPVLFCDDAGTVVAAAHAGWRGLAAGVLEATVRSLPVLPAKLMAWLGAAIGPQSFEVGAEVRDAFLMNHPQAASGFSSLAKNKYRADLYTLARQRLAAAGVARVFGGNRCTYRESGDFFSYRRDGQCGRMATLIWRV